jgi:hypothetical protein
MNLSLKNRQEGNKIFQSINENLSPLIIQSRLSEAQKCYNRALTEATTNEDISSACKNLFSVSYRLQKFYSTHEFNDIKVDFHAEMSQKYAKDALSYGFNFQSDEWVERLKESSEEAFIDYYKALLSRSYEERILALLKISRASSKNICVLINYRICECYYRRADELLHSNLIKQAFAKNNECDYFYEESLKDAKENDQIVDELEELKDDFILQRLMLEGLKSKLVAKNLLKECLNSHEELNFDLIWDVIDWFKDAIVKMRGKDIESEAEISSDLGYVYGNILKLKEKSKNYFHISWHLIDSLRPKVFTRFKWYQRCAQAIQQYQQEKIDKETESFEADKKKVYDQIKDDLQKLKNKAKDGSFDFLPFIYKDYPPKNPKHTLSGSLDAKNIKKTIQISISHYHPDKNPKDKYGDAWYYISDDITKILTNFYETMKSCD